MSTPTWAVELPATKASAAHSLRLIPGIEARHSEFGDALWLRGSEIDSATTRLVRQLPCLRRFTLLEDGRAIPDGSKVPVVTLLGSGWIPLRHLEPLQPPDFQSPGSVVPEISLQLVPASSEESPAGLCLPFQVWHDYALSASIHRLAPLIFAASEDARAVVLGSPLPPLLGDFFSMDHGIAIPFGYSLHPPVDKTSLSNRFRLNDRDLLLFHSNNSCEMISASDFSAATRSAIRQTAAALAEQIQS